MNKVSLFDTDLNSDYLKAKILKQESRILKKFPSLDADGNFFDGQTGLGENSLTSRANHFNVLKWFGTDRLRKWIKKSYDIHTDSKGETIYVQCWANVLRKGQKINAHNHSDDPQSLSGNVVVFTDEKTNTYYDGTPVENVNGKLVIFPSTVFHWTDTYTGDNERITIAFDIISKDRWKNDIEDYRKSHWIRLK
jgi:hypothetical protein